MWWFSLAIQSGIERIYWDKHLLTYFLILSLFQEGENSQSSILSIGHTLSLAGASHLFSPICSMQTDSISGPGDHSSTPMESSCFSFPSCTTFCGVNLPWKYAGPQEEDINSNSQASWPATLWSLRAAVHHPNTTLKESIINLEESLFSASCLWPHNRGGGGLSTHPDIRYCAVEQQMAWSSWRTYFEIFPFSLAHSLFLLFNRNIPAWGLSLFLT